MTAPGRSAASGRRRTVPTQLAALAAGVSEATIRKWASRGKICRYGTPGRAEYDLDELMEIVPGGHGQVGSGRRRTEGER